MNKILVDSSVLLDIFTQDQAWSDWSSAPMSAVEKMPILTRDPKRYRTYFPTVRLICPALS
jgi:hypothetical protein